MNSVFNKLKSVIMRGGKKKNMLISVVILVEIILLLVVATYAWVETVSSIKITNEANTKGTIIDDTKYTDMLIGGENDTIDLLDYFEPSGDMHLAPASSADGKTFYFPKANITSNFIYRKGNVSDKNTTYLSASFKLRADTNADFFFTATPAISVSDDIRVSVTAYTEGDNPEGEFDPVSGKLISNTKIYANNASTTAVVNSTTGATGATTVEKFTDHQKGKNSTARLFAVGANETKYVTINVWLQKKTADNSDLTQNMSVSQAIKYLGITSSLTPRHVTLIPTPTWDQSDVNETFYAWCWGATNGDASRLYKLELDDNEHYGFDYNGTYQNTLFLRSGNADLTKEYLEAGHWNDNTVWDKTEDTSIPNDPVDPTFIIETINGSSEDDDSNKKNINDWDSDPGNRPKKSTGSWHDPAIIKLGYVTDQSSTWGTLSATTYIGTTTSTHVMEQTNSDSQKHIDTVHAWPGKLIQLKATAKTNYAFVGWYTDAAGTTPAPTVNSTAYTASTYKPNAPSTASEITYYAKFKETRTLTIYRTVDGSTSSTAAAGTITINGSTTGNTATSKSVTVDKGSSVTFSASAATGYTFAGFYTTQTGSTMATSPVTLNSNTPYYARFTTNTHTVNLNTIGSTGSTVQYGSETAATSVEKTGVKYNSSVTIKANPASGYKFVGWYTNSSGTGTAASTNASYTFTMGDADVTYYAKFAEADYYLTGYINGNDYDGTSYKFTKGSGSTYTLTTTFTGNHATTGCQYVTIFDGTNAYHPANHEAGTGTAGSTVNTSPKADNKWKVDAPNGTKVTFTWNSSTKVLSWSITYRVYFKNDCGFSNVYVVLLNSSYWDNTNGSGAYGYTMHKMTYDSTKKLYYYDIGSTKHSGYIAFAQADQSGYGNFYKTKAVYRGDFSVTTPVYDAPSSKDDTKNQTDYYNNGSWTTYN